MSPVHTILVSTRRVLARRAWIQWVVIATVAAVIAASVHARLQQVDRQRDSWGSTRTVLVAIGFTDIGDPIDVEPRDLPIAMIPDGALDPADETPDDGAGRRLARQRVGTGEIVSRLDVVAASGPQAMTPAGWLAVPVVESPRSGALLGDRVQVASDGFVISADAVVVGVAGVFGERMCEVARRHIFHVMLTPSANRAHRDHLHFDLARSSEDATLQ